MFHPFIIALLVLAILAPIGWDFAKTSAPTSLRFEVDEVLVHNKAEGDELKIVVDRTINRAFLARWIVEVHEERTDGRFELRAGCTGTDRNNYQPGDKMPTPVSLKWWIGHDRCTLPPGRYRIDTVWRLFLGRWGDRDVRNRSNVFTVTARS